MSIAIIRETIYLQECLICSDLSQLRSAGGKPRNDAEIGWKHQCCNWSFTSWDFALSNSHFPHSSTLISYTCSRGKYSEVRLVALVQGSSRQSASDLLQVPRNHQCPQSSWLHATWSLHRQEQHELRTSAADEGLQQALTPCTLHPLHQHNSSDCHCAFPAAPNAYHTSEPSQ